MNGKAENIEQAKEMWIAFEGKIAKRLVSVSQKTDKAIPADTSAAPLNIDNGSFEKYQTKIESIKIIQNFFKRTLRSDTCSLHS